MTKTAVSKSMRRLPVTERIELLDELWHSIAADQSSIPVTEDQKAVIDDCLAEIERHPGRGMTLLDFRRFLRETSRQIKDGNQRKRAG
jgi:putative addiction module component (TIGR02574 family)